MNIEYKGYRITAWPERDDTTGLWKGRYGILDQKGAVAYESFVEPPDDENKTHEAASSKAREWVDGQQRARDYRRFFHIRRAVAESLPDIDREPGADSLLFRLRVRFPWYAAPLLPRRSCPAPVPCISAPRRSW